MTPLDNKWYWTGGTSPMDWTEESTDWKFQATQWKNIFPPTHLSHPGFKPDENAIFPGQSPSEYPNPPLSTTCCWWKFGAKFVHRTPYTFAVRRTSVRPAVLAFAVPNDFNFHPLYLLAVAVRLTITANLLDSLYPLAQYITLRSTGSKTVIYQR